MNESNYPEIVKKYPEFIPVYEWWEKDGKQTVTILVVILALFGGWKLYQQHTAAVKAAASDALISAFTTEELEDAVSKYGSKDAGSSLKLRLAKSYYDGGRYEEALAQYESLVGQTSDGFGEIPVVGQAQCLEALGKFDEAAKAYEAFVTENEKSPFALTAKLGIARCTCQAGDKAKALEQLAKLKDENKADELAKARVEATEAVVKRFVAK